MIGDVPRMLALVDADVFDISHTKSSISESILESDTSTGPEDMTSQLQPLGIAINKPFKDSSRKHYTGWLTLQQRQLTVLVWHTLFLATCEIKSLAFGKSNIFDSRSFELLGGSNYQLAIIL